MKITNLLFILMLNSFFNLKAQKVESSAYSLMLNTLLAHSVPEVSVSEIEINANDLVLIDSREKNEFEVSHLKNAIWVGYTNLDLSPLEGLAKNKKIVVYCSVGYRSEKVVEKLKEKGFKNVSNLYGGIFEWMNQDRQVVNKSGQPTDSIHAYNRMWGVWLTKGKKVY